MSSRVVEIVSINHFTFFPAQEPHCLDLRCNNYTRRFGLFTSHFYGLIHGSECDKLCALLQDSKIEVIVGRTVIGLRDSDHGM